MTADSILGNTTSYYATYCCRAEVDMNNESHHKDIACMISDRSVASKECRGKGQSQRSLSNGANSSLVFFSTVPRQTQGASTYE